MKMDKYKGQGEFSSTKSTRMPRNMYDCNTVLSVPLEHRLITKRQSGGA